MSSQSLLSMAINAIDCGYQNTQTTSVPECATKRDVTCKLYDNSAYCPKHGFMLAWAKYAQYVFISSDDSEVVDE